VIDSTQRFSSRVENYVRYRPSYPPAILEPLRQVCGLTSDHTIADVGAGTGLLSELFLKNGNRVYGVEPNREMRAAAERLLAHHENFISVAGTAEATTLPDQSVAFVVAGQAFHWFDPVRARQEFLRILRPGGWVALAWNYRRVTATPFMAAYEALVQRYSSKESARALHQPDDDEKQVMDFFGPNGCRQAIFPNQQRFDFAGLQGRLLSSSYAPETGHPNHEPMLAELRQLFDEHQVDGQVAVVYDTKLFYGQLAA
jgi:SAM-dependent methyltransferase